MKRIVTEWHGFMCYLGVHEPSATEGNTACTRRHFV